MVKFDFFCDHLKKMKYFPDMMKIGNIFDAY